MAKEAVSENSGQDRGHPSPAERGERIHIQNPRDLQSPGLLLGDVCLGP